MRSSSTCIVLLARPPHRVRPSEPRRLEAARSAGGAQGMHVWRTAHPAAIAVRRGARLACWMIVSGGCLPRARRARHPEDAMPLDPQFRSVIDQATAAGALPLVQATAQETRSHYRSLAVSRRGADFVPEPVAKVVDDAVDGPAGPVPVRVYTPTGDRGRVITYLHGGGWVVGDLDTHDPVCRRVANAVGATVVAVDYRLAPEHPYPAPLDDAMAALAWTADRYPGLPHVVAGDSAGASLAAGAALRARDGNGPALAAQLLVYPATDPSMSTPSMRDNGEGYFLTRADMAWFYDQYLPDRA